MGLCTSCKFKTRKNKCTKNFVFSHEKPSCVGYEGASINIKYHSSNDKTHILFWAKVV